MAVFIFLQFTVKLFQIKLIWEKKCLCMKFRCTKNSTAWGAVKAIAHWVRNFRMHFSVFFFVFLILSYQNAWNRCENAENRTWSNFFFWWTKVSEAVCKRDWHNMRSYLFFNVRKFRTEISDSVCNDLKASTHVWVTKVKLAFTWLKNSLMSAMQDLVIVVQRKIERSILFYDVFITNLQLHLYLKSLCASPKSRNILVSVTTDRDNHVWSAFVFRALQSQ